MMFAFYNYIVIVLLGFLIVLPDPTDSFPFNGLLPITKIQCNWFFSSSLHVSPEPIDSVEDCAKNSKNNVYMHVDSYSDGEPDAFRDDAKRIAKQLEIPLHSAVDESNPSKPEESDVSHALRLVPYEYGNNGDGSAAATTFALAIEPVSIDGAASTRRKRRKNPRKKSSAVVAAAAYFVDLCPPPNSRAGRRASGASGKADLLVKAVGPRKGSTIDPATGSRDGAVVWDLTAGLGQDALVLARNGAKRVCMVERNPVVAALLQDAMRRLELLAAMPPSESSTKNTARDLLEVLSLSVGEGRHVLASAEDCDVVYLDPMFPPRQKQSSVKKGMSILHGLLETHIADSPDKDQRDQRARGEQELLATALEAAKLRVVVKRPIKATPLGDGSTKPSHTLLGSVNRWDVYVKTANLTA